MRIFSALVLLAIVALLVYLGPAYCVGAVGIMGLMVMDEILHNFLKIDRSKSAYIISALIYCLCFIGFMFKQQLVTPVLINLALANNILLVWFLFKFTPSKLDLSQTLNRYPFLVSLFVFIPIAVIASLFFFNDWKLYFMAMIVINFGMDTGAWFFGKNFGKNKLWPEVSPKKTVEGLIGGMIFSGIIGLIYWKAAFGHVPWALYILLFVFALFSQVGDLIQSKIKRYFDVKDSSSLIPGHGGVYDRIDSLLFIAPFFLYMLRHLGL